MKKLLTLSALALAMQPLAALAAPVTLQSNWECATASCSFTGTGVLTLTYDDTAAGVADGNATFPSSSYYDAITAATMTFGNFSFTLDSTVQSRIQVRQGRDAGYDALLSFSLRDAGNAQYHFTATIEDHDQTNGGVELSWLAGLLDDEATTATLLPNGVGPNAPGGLPYWLLQETALTQVPVPAAAWLFGSSMLGLAGLARRRKA